MTMHRSRLAGFIIDCETGDLDEAADFWRQALGYGPLPLSGPGEDNYRGLDTGRNGVHIEVQQVDHPSRVHLDIETDDIEAEVRRLERLGAKRVKQAKTWWVMQAPTGHRFLRRESAKRELRRHGLTVVAETVKPLPLFALGACPSDGWRWIWSNPYADDFRKRS